MPTLGVFSVSAFCSAINTTQTRIHKWRIRQRAVGDILTRTIHIVQAATNSDLRAPIQILYLSYVGDLKSMAGEWAARFSHMRTRPGPKMPRLSQMQQQPWNVSHLKGMTVDDSHASMLARRCIFQ